jgi:hypothetical protein
MLLHIFKTDSQVWFCHENLIEEVFGVRVDIFAVVPDLTL